MGITTDLFTSQPLDENLICALCWDVLERPMNACLEGHCFCASCVASILGVAAPAPGSPWPVPSSPSSQQTRCPSCRGPIQSPLVPNRALQNIIHSLQIKCPYHHPESVEPARRRQRTSELGNASSGADHMCPWQGPSQELESHLRECEYADAECPHGCGARVGRMAFEEHKLTCRNRPVKCATCAVEFPFTDVDAHERACPEKTVACQFCGESMKRKALGKPPRHINGTDSLELDGHYAQCPKIPIHCAFRTCGCYRCFPRDAQGQHYMEHAEQHGRLVNRNIEELRGHMDWENCRITFEVEEGQFQTDSSEPLSIRSSTVTVAGEDVYIAMELRGQDDPAKIFVRVQNSRWSSVMIDSLYLYVKIDPRLGVDGALLETAAGETVRLEGGVVEGTDKSYGGPFLCNRRRGERVEDPAPGEREYEYHRVQVTRKDLATALQPGEPGAPRAMSVRASFRVRKHNNVKLRVRAN